MAGIAYENSLTTGHATAPPTTLISTQNLVVAEGRNIIVEGDRIREHAYKDDRPHGGVVICDVNETVYIMGKKMAQVGDRITCGDTISEGSSISVLR